MSHMKRPLRFLTTIVGMLALVSIVFGVFYFQRGTVHASSNDDGIGTPKYITDGGVSNFSSNADTIPYWRSSFTDPTNGVTYPYTMVGTNPYKGNVTTTVPTVIIPFSFTFAQSASSNNVLDGTSKVPLTVQSPVFQSANIGAAASTTASAPPVGVAPANARPVNEPSDVTQVGDAIYRAQWGKSSSGYHVKLGQPKVLSTVSYTVPANQGFITVGQRTGVRIGLLDYHWFSNRLNETMRNLQISSHVLPIFLVYNTFLYIGNSSNCCVLGYHGATTSLNGNGQQEVHTYMFASYSEPGIFGKNPGDAFSYVQDIHGLSHEVQEWMDDPFVNNVINPWLTPTAPQYGCTSDLETGDPVVGFGFTVTMPNGVNYHPEDEVHYSWFTRESPSRAASGYYTYLNNFAGVAHGC
ncbi:MAG TPA: hypothetical protein VHZ51_10020 [Ktedonobacteraceae bacterium]|jgi:hypothetical protein|nr:hypothetical protein [Ktedonobacteraceae bacterium]